MATPDPASLSACDENVPLLPITRQFDFGQFVFLHNQTDATQATPKQPERIVWDPSHGVLQAYRDWRERRARQLPPGIAKDRPNPVPDLLGGESLQKLLSKDKPPALAPVEIKVSASELLELTQQDDGELTYKSEKFKVELDDHARVALGAGKSAMATLSPTDDSSKAAPFMTELVPDLQTKQLTADDIDRVLAKGHLSSNGQSESFDIDSRVASALLAGESVVAHTNGGGEGLVLLQPSAELVRPAATNISFEDLASFIAAPVIPAADGRAISVHLKPSDISELRERGTAIVKVGESPVTLRAVGGGSMAPARYGGDDYGAPVMARYGMRAATSGAQDHVAIDPSAYRALLESTVQASGGTVLGPVVDDTPASVVANEIGLPIAVFLPWRQTWSLKGFSRGDLRHSLALAPQEETLIEINSWQKRQRTLDQSAETDVEQTFDLSSNEKDSDDVFKELTTGSDFSWQIGGSIDASYSYASASIAVSAGGQVTSADQMQAIARNTQQKMKESTQKASAKIRSKRTTHITDAIENGSQDRVTRRIVNPNYSHTLTLDFFETLSHYEVTLEANPDRLTMVALIPNPLLMKSNESFTSLLIRSNETALRRALLEPALIDGFDAVRKICAYNSAREILAEQAVEEKSNDETKGERIPNDKKDNANAPTPEEKDLIELMKSIRKAVQRVAGAADFMPALNKLAKLELLTQDDLVKCQHKLFIVVAEKYLSGVLSAIRSIPDAPTVEDAARLAAVIPGPDASVKLSNLNDKTDNDKLDCGGFGRLIDNVLPGYWGWKYGTCRENGCLGLNDEGIGQLVDTLPRIYGAYLAKRKEGNAKKEITAAAEGASAEQDKLSTEDKLGMAFPLDELSSAYERAEALTAHLEAHKEHYCFAMFESLSPAEQNEWIETQSGGKLKVGMFEPRVLAINGPDLAIPLAPPPAGELKTMLESLRKQFDEAFGGTKDKPDTFIFPTPGLTINSRMGKCSATEAFIDDSRKIELRRLAAEAAIAEHEAERRAARIKNDDLDDPEVESAPLHVSVEGPK